MYHVDNVDGLTTTSYLSLNISIISCGCFPSFLGSRARFFCSHVNFCLGGVGDGEDLHPEPVRPGRGDDVFIGFTFNAVNFDISTSSPPSSYVIVLDDDGDAADGDADGDAADGD